MGRIGWVILGVLVVVGTMSGQAAVRQMPIWHRIAIGLASVAAAVAIFVPSALILAYFSRYILGVTDFEDASLGFVAPIAMILVYVGPFACSLLTPLIISKIGLRWWRDEEQVSHCA